jgi:hypothetical protein
MDLADWVNQEALALWRETFKSQEDILLPLVYSPLKKSALLFIGLNPSDHLIKLKKILNDTELCPNNFNLKEFYSFSNLYNFDLPLSQKFEQCSRENYPYFKKFDKISKDTKLYWEHIDLFFYRITSQKDFIKKIYINKKRGELTEFGKCQLELSKELITKINPQIIVVVNAYASTIFEYEFKAKFNEEKGYHEIELNNKILPVFLGSMLTGQRALDNYTFERLKWHIRQAIKGIKDES